MLRDRASRTLARRDAACCKIYIDAALIPSWFQEIELLSATDLLSLLTYHRRCGDAVFALRLDLSWITSHYGSSEACAWMSGYDHHYGGCGCQQSNTPRYKLSWFSYSPQWWEDFMEETFTALRDTPCKETLKAVAEKAVQTVKALNCGVCSGKITEGMRDFVELCTRKVEETVSQVGSAPIETHIDLNSFLGRSSWSCISREMSWNRYYSGVGACFHQRCVTVSISNVSVYMSMYITQVGLKHKLCKLSTSMYWTIRIVGQAQARCLELWLTVRHVEVLNHVRENHDLHCPLAKFGLSPITLPASQWTAHDPGRACVRLIEAPSA